MTKGTPVRRWASIKANKDFINIKSCSGYIDAIEDIDQKDEFLEVDTPSQELGFHIREALRLSRFINPIEQKELSSYLHSPDRHAAWLKSTMRKFSYKTKSMMFKPMVSCSIMLQDGHITLRPTHQSTLDGWDGKGLTEADNVTISESRNDFELGIAARVVLARCTSRYKKLSN